MSFSNSSSGVDAGSGRLWDPAGSSVGTLIMSVSAGRGKKHDAAAALPRLHGTAGATSLPSAMTLHVPNLQHMGKQIRPLPISEVHTSIPLVQNAFLQVSVRSALILSLLYSLGKGHRDLQ